MKIFKRKERDSLFFKIAKELDSTTDLPVKPSRFSISVSNHHLYKDILGKKSKINILETNLTGGKNNITVISTPEAEAIAGVGAIRRTGKKYEFVLPRFHIGVPAQLDMEVAMYHLTMTPVFKKILEKSNDKNSGIIYFAREGHLTEWQKAVYLTTGKNLPTTLVNISHKPASNSFSRTAVLASEPKLEGFNLNNLKFLYLCDPLASGMQHLAMLEKLENMGYLPKNIVIIAPMATKFGLEVLSRFCKIKKINFYAGVCSSILDIQKPLRYYSPYPKNENQVADKELHKFLKNYSGEIINSICIRCNWTGSFWGGNSLPLSDSEKELTSFGINNKKLTSLSEIILKEISNNKIRKKLMPFSTLIC